MPVRHVESFSFELPLDAVETEGPSDSQQVIVTLGREAAESLHTDLGMALYPGGVRGADVPAQVPFPAAWSAMEAIEPDETSMTPEQALAAMQVQAARGYEPIPHYTPGEGGSTFGNAHV